VRETCRASSGFNNPVKRKRGTRGSRREGEKKYSMSIISNISKPPTWKRGEGGSEEEQGGEKRGRKKNLVFDPKFLRYL